MFRIFCYKEQSKWPEFLSFFETAINENYHDTTEYTPAELDSGTKPERFWNNYLRRPKTYNLPLPVQCKNQLVKDRIVEKGRKRADKFNTTHKLTNFVVGEKMLLKAIPVGRRDINVAAKFFRLYNGPYLLAEQLAPHTFIVTTLDRTKTVGKYHASSLRKYYE